MPSFAEIRAYAKANYTTLEDGEEALTLEFKFAGDRSQRVRLVHHEAFDKDWIEFRSVVCEKSELAAEEALRANDGMTIGALALDGEGRYVLSYRAALDTMDEDEFELPLLAVAHTADKLEAKYAKKDVR